VAGTGSRVWCSREPHVNVWSICRLICERQVLISSRGSPRNMSAASHKGLSGESLSLSLAHSRFCLSRTTSMPSASPQVDLSPHLRFYYSLSLKNRPRLSFPRYNHNFFHPTRLNSFNITIGSFKTWCWRWMLEIEWSYEIINGQICEEKNRKGKDLRGEGGILKNTAKKIKIRCIRYTLRYNGLVG
jgi:hypothetical protein